MNQIDGEAESQKARINRIVTQFEVGCLILLFAGICTIPIANEVLDYGFSGMIGTNAPGEIAGGKSYVYCNGFVDLSCDYYVSSDDAPGDLYLMATWFTDSPRERSFLISADGRLVVTESGLSKYEYDSPYPKPGGQQQLIYTHAFDLDTTDYIKPKESINDEDEAAHRARHEEIAKMLEAHGGVGSRSSMLSVSFEMRPLGYWEWWRWRKMMSAAQNRKSNQ